MENAETLRGIVAKLSGTEAGKIGPDFSFKIPGLQGSVRRAALAAAIRRQLGVTTPAAYSASTYGELERAVFGGPASVATAISGIAPVKPSVLATSVATFASTSGASELRCGVDVEMISELPEAMDYREHEFYKDSFTPEEIAYCVMQPDPRMHFAARWCAKEALHKCDPAFRSEKMNRVEVVRKEDGEVSLRHHGGSVQTLPHAVSLSHTNTFAMAFVVKPAVLPAPVSPPVARTSVPPASSGGGFGFGVIAWIAAMALGLIALVRTFH